MAFQKFCNVLSVPLFRVSPGKLYSPLRVFFWLTAVQKNSDVLLLRPDLTAVPFSADE